MKQLSGLDASFLYMETASQFGHVSSLSIYERPDDPDYEPLPSWRHQIERRLHLLEPLRRRLRDVPFELDHPFWVDDPDFDLDFHVRHTAVPPPGSDEQLAELVARIVGRPLDRRRPLWETLRHRGPARRPLRHPHQGAPRHDRRRVRRRAARADARRRPGRRRDRGRPRTTGGPSAMPTDGEVLTARRRNLVRKPARAVAAGRPHRARARPGHAQPGPGRRRQPGARRPPRPAGRGAQHRPQRVARGRGDRPAAVGGGAPHAVQRHHHAHRRFAFRSTSLDAVKGIKNALGATVNDVVMAVCAGGLRTWLEQHDALPDQPLVAMVPVSIRTGEETEKWTNRVSCIFAAAAHRRTRPGAAGASGSTRRWSSAKELFDAVPADALTDFAQFPPPAVFARAMRTATRLTARFSSPVNVVISNVPGPRQPLYTAGAKLLHYYPVSTIVDGQGLNITVQSYLDTLDFGLVACRELVPDLWDMVDAIIDDLVALGKATGVDVPL